MHWIFRSPKPEKVIELMGKYQIPEIIAKLMDARGLHEARNLERFFSPNISQLHDPFSMKNLDMAASRTIKNIKSKSPIFVFGDYDVDGTTGASLLHAGLSSLGANVKTYIPNREKEGYGLSELGIDKAEELGADLFITCDCGIYAINHVNYANKKGMDVIITDHHIPGNILPDAFAILNPKQNDCRYPFKELCGAGVALKLISGIVEKMRLSFDFIIDLLDLAALGTSADLVSMKDENRVIVHCGLQILRTTHRPGLRELLKIVNMDLYRDLTVNQVVFHIAPRINAAGRLGNANRVIELFTTTDKIRAKTLAIELNQENKMRQTIQQSVLDEAFLMVNTEFDLSRDKAIILGSQYWHQGVVGIVASKIKEQFNRPAVIISFDKKGFGKGSARSVNGLDLYKALNATGEYLDNFGGHAMAAGLTIKKSQLAGFRKSFLAYANKIFQETDLEPILYLDGIIKLTDVNKTFMDFLKKLSPYGPGNRRPKFAIRNVKISENPRIIGNGNHLRFQVKQNQNSFQVIGFNMAHHYQDLIKGKPIDIACIFEINRWKGQETINTC